MTFSLKYSPYLLLVHLMYFFLFDLQWPISDQQTSVVGSQKYSAKSISNNKPHEDFLIPFKGNI